VSQFTLLDWIVVIIIAYSVAMSVVRGFVREVLGLATVVAGLLIAAWFHSTLAGVLEGFLRTENQALFASFVLLFGGTLLVGFTLIHFIRRFFEFAHIQWFDRLLGAAFGLLRGWLVAAVVFLTLTSFGIASDAVRNATLSHYFLPAVRFVATLTPFDMKARFLIGYAEVERWWESLDLVNPEFEPGTPPSAEAEADDDGAGP
jgi:membrane protein required for colicin V production